MKADHLQIDSAKVNLIHLIWRMWKYQIPSADIWSKIQPLSELFGFVAVTNAEKTVYRLVCRIVAEYGIHREAILKSHKGNKQHPQAADSQMQFDTLDTSLSKIRIVLLVQIGKETLSDKFR